MKMALGLSKLAIILYPQTNQPSILESTLQFQLTFLPFFRRLRIIFRPSVVDMRVLKPETFRTE